MKKVINEQGFRKAMRAGKTWTTLDCQLSETEEGRWYFEIDKHVFEKGNGKGAAIRTRQQFYDPKGGGGCNDHLQNQFQFAGQAPATPLAYFNIVVQEADGAVTSGYAENHPNITVAQIRP